MKKSEEAKKKSEVKIPPLNFQTAAFTIEGLTPYCQQRFYKKYEMMEKMQQGSTAKKGGKLPPRDFEKDCEESKHYSTDGWIGIPAAAFRNAMISVCRVVGFHMTKAKLCITVMADGMDRNDDIPLVKIEGEPEMSTAPVRNATGVIDIRSRPLWREWGATIQVVFDADVFTLEDVTNLMVRVGRQVGVGEGRPDGPKGTGVGWGMFKVL